MQLYNDDMRNILKDMADNSIDCIVTDPPYKTTPFGCTYGVGGMLIEEKFMKGKVFNNTIDIKDYINELYRVLKDTGHCYIMCNNINLKDFLIEIENAGFHIFKTLIWAKSNCITNQFYMDSHEYIIFCRKGAAKKINNCGTRSVLYFDNVKNGINPTAKPVELMQVFIENSTKPGDTVLDPFMGSGSTGEACIKSKRNFIGIEIDKEQFAKTKSSLDACSRFVKVGLI